MHFSQVCYHKTLRFPLFLPLWEKTRETFSAFTYYLIQQAGR